MRLSRFLPTSLILLFFHDFTGSAFAQAAPSAAPRPAAPLAFAQNDRLPKSFQELAVTRSDGSTLTAFVSNFEKGELKRKSVLIYLDGSGAQSLFFATPDGRIGTSLFGVLARQADPKYHVVAIEKRGAVFGESGARPGSGEGASAEYTKHATLESRVADVRLLLDALGAQPWVDASRIVLVGHSEGAVIAAGVAGEDPRVTHVAFLSGSGAPQSFDFIVFTRKRLAKEGKSPEEIEAAVAGLERQYRDILAHPEDDKKFFMGHGYRRWASYFRHDPAASLSAGRAKLFLAHGTEDESVPIESFDRLTTELLRAGRADVTIRRYVGRNHGLFMPPNPPPDKPVMEDVFAEVLVWCEK